MATPIGQIIAAIASIIVLLIAYAIFNPIIDGVLSGLVIDVLNNSNSANVAINKGALLLTVNIVVMGIKVFAIFVIFAVLTRLFLYLGYLTEEQEVY